MHHAKTLLRCEIKTILQTLSEEDKQKQSERICTQIQAIFYHKQMEHIGLIVPFPNEPDIRSVIERARKNNKKTYFPSITNNTMYFLIAQSRDDFETVHLFGKEMMVPQGSLDEPLLDSVLVPGFAFTEDGYRLGKGGGWYDRYLRIHPDLLSIGVCFREQIVAQLPLDRWDQRVQVVISG